MKVLHIIPSLRTGGAERLVLDICNELRKQGHEVKLVYFHDRNDYRYLSEQINPQFLPVHVRPSVMGKWDINLKPLNELIGSFKPQVIHSHLFEAEILSHENIFEGTRYFSHCHDNMPQLRNFSFETIFQKSRLTDFYEKQHLIKKYLKSDNKFIAISRDTKQYFENVLPEKLSRNVVLLNNAIDFERFNAVYQKRELGSLRMINVGSFVAKKNQQFLVEVVNALVEKNVDVKLTMLGDGPLLEDVKQKIKELGLQKFIECKGNVENVEQYLKEANLYVHSATYEPFGLVLLEAMATGLPVVSLDGRGNRDIMKDGENGFVLKEQDTAAFAEKIELAYKNRELYNTLSSGALQTAKTYNISDYVKKLIVLYQSSLVKD
ncbi:MAG: glycosyltransferase [Bacteroidota bacterium]